MRSWEREVICLAMNMRGDKFWMWWEKNLNFRRGEKFWMWRSLNPRFSFHFWPEVWYSDHITERFTCNLAPLVIREELSERHLVGTDRDPDPTCKEFEGSVVVLSWICIACIKCMEPLSFDTPAQTDVVRRFPTSAKVFVSVSAGTRTRDLPYDLATQPPRLHLIIKMWKSVYKPFLDSLD